MKRSACVVSCALRGCLFPDCHILLVFVSFLSVGLIPARNLESRGSSVASCRSDQP